MSNRRPVARLVAKHKTTGKYTDIATVWPVHEKIGGDFGDLGDGPRSVRFGNTGNNNPDYNVTIEQVMEIIQNADDYFIDLKEPFKRDDG